jgi:hypothetical protein
MKTFEEKRDEMFVEYLISKVTKDLREWHPATVSGMPGVHMVISKDVKGLTMVASWVKTKDVSALTDEDISDMLDGSRGRAVN